MKEIVFDIEDCMFGDGSHHIHIAEAFDSKELAETYAKGIKSALKLQELVKEKIEQRHPNFDGLLPSKTFIDLQKQHSSTKHTLKSLVEESENA